VHIHNVYFWLKSNLDSDGTAAFEEGLSALINDPRARSGYYGRPANTRRGVIENTYTYGLVLTFDDLAAHDEYQAGVPHLKFVEDHAGKWDRVVVHDIETVP
jgi:hypothetical protein